MSDTVKHTRLHPWHVGQGANMARFGDYDMPLWYPAGAKSEHLAVLTAAGLFDTSHMCAVTVRGDDSRELLQRCFSKDLERCIGKPGGPLTPGKSVYGVFLNETGEVIDDAIVFEVAADDYLVVVNSGMGAVISEHLRTYNRTGAAVITDLTDAVGKIDIQGPASARILAQVLKDPQGVFDKLPYFSFKGHFDTGVPSFEEVALKDGTPILLSRTGYTGEFGFELFTPPDHFLGTWDRILAAGEAFGLIPCGLAARDSLRAGAALPLSHQDIGPWPFLNNPWLFALPYTADRSGFTKPFIGAEALLSSTFAETTLPFAGFDLRKVSTADPAVVVDASGQTTGRVLTCATDMAIGRHEGRIYSVNSPDRPAGFIARGLCCGFVRLTARLNPGTSVVLKDRRRKITVEIVADIRPDRTARRPLGDFL
jgi:aminomethyltransferase